MRLYLVILALVVRIGLSTSIPFCNPPPSSLSSSITKNSEGNVKQQQTDDVILSTDGEKNTSPKTTESSEPSDVSYEKARFIRTKYGHAAAQPLYRDILLQQYNASIKKKNHSKDNHHEQQQQREEDNIDLSAACRIAASTSSPERHNLACPIKSLDDIQQLRVLFKKSKFDRKHVHAVFGISRDSVGYFPAGPIYVKPVTVGGGASRLPMLIPEGEEEEEEEGWERSLKCLITMFLLGFSVPKKILSKHLIGGTNTIHLLQCLGLALPDEIDSDLIVPYVSLFPMDVDVIDESNSYKQQSASSLSSSSSSSSVESIVLVTDWHPSVLSRTTVGGRRTTKVGGGKDDQANSSSSNVEIQEQETKEDGAVMYIGPDSLSLVRNLPLYSYLNQRRKHTNNQSNAVPSNNETTISTTSTKSGNAQQEQCPIRVLDFCTGSGIQAITTLVSLAKTNPSATAICVDVNERALRFVQFNALLNGFGKDRIKVVKGDLISGKTLPFLSLSSIDEGKEEDGEMAMMKRGRKEKLLVEREDDLETSLSLAFNNIGVDDDDNKGMNQKQQRFFDIILANPPFIPVPPQIPLPNNEEEESVQCQAASNYEDDGDLSQQPKVNKPSDGTTHHSIAQRYGLFSSGGPDGEDVLRAIVSLSSKLLRKDGGLLAIVSEFMNPPLIATISDDMLSPEDEQKVDEVGHRNTSTTTKIMNSNTDSYSNLCRRMEYWWEEGNVIHSNDRNESSILPYSKTYFARGILFTNEYPVPAMTYAARRADDATEYKIWENHLHTMNITHVSPGLLFVQTNNDVDALGNLNLHHVLVPKSKTGSIWTPHNQHAVDFARELWSRFVNKRS